MWLYFGRTSRRLGSGYRSLPFDAVHGGEEEHSPGLGALHLQAHNAGQLRQCLDLHHARHDRPVWEVTLP